VGNKTARDRNAPARPEFTAHQRAELTALGLYPEQVQRLEESLAGIISYMRPRPRMQDVRDKLEDLVKPAKILEKRYARLMRSREPASGQARTLLDFAQEHLGHTDWRTLRNCLLTAAEIITEARSSVSQNRRSVFRPRAYLIQSILRALELGYAEHFNKAAPRFRMVVTRKKKPFPDIVLIVAHASGGWSSEDAIRDYQSVVGSRPPKNRT
jgi:hypothetical protein